MSIYSIVVICWQRTDKVKVKYSQSDSSMYGLFVVIAKYALIII